MAKDLQIPIRVHPEILKILGQYLVIDSVRAASELVKNSYDADATEVVLEFTDDGEREISIQDNGTGMTPSEIRNGWLQIGTPMKRRRKISRRFGRPMSGSMGIGRLAAFSLGEQVVLETGVNRNNWYRVTLDLPKLLKFSDFARLKAQARIMQTAPAEHGTIVRVKKPRWWPDKDEVDALKLRLAMIRGPDEVQDFKVFLAHSGVKEELGLEEALPVPPLVLSGRVLPNGKARYEIKAENALYEGEESIREDGWTKTSKESYGNLDGVEIEARWYPRGDRPSVEYWRTTVPRDTLAETAGVRVYRDGIRVLPYGEKGNDWLRLEKKYVAAGARERRARPGNVVGWVLITRERNPGLEDTANRDGLLAGDAFNELVSFSGRAFDFVAEVRRELEPLVSKPRVVNERAVGDALRSAEDLEEHVRDSPEALALIKGIEQLLVAVKDEYDLMSLYRDRLTAGNLVRLIMHDVGVSLQSSSDLIAESAQTPCSEDLHSQTLPIVEDLVPRLLGAYSLLKGSGRSGAYRRSRVDVVSLAQSIKERFESTLRMKLLMAIEGEDVTANLREADLWAVLVNLVHNAVTSDEYEQAGERQFPQERRVILSVRGDHGDLVLECEDNGPGLPDKPKGWIWQPFNSTREEGGSGLGLWIVADVATWYAGSYSASVSTRFSQGSMFSVVLPGVVPSGLQ